MVHKSMFKIIQFFLLFLAFDVMATESCIQLPEMSSDYTISLDGETFVFVNEKNNCLEVINPNGVRYIRFKDISEIRDISPNINVSLSYDSRFVAVGFNASESIYIVKVIAVKNMQLVLEEKATSAVWMKGSNRLIIVPNYSLDELQTTPGIIIYSAETNKKKLDAKDHYFTGKIVTGGNKIIANVMEFKNDQPIFRTIIYDLGK